MSDSLRYNIEDVRLGYDGCYEPYPLREDKISTFNHRHKEILKFYGLEVMEGTIYSIDSQVNSKSNLGVFRNKQIRQSVILSAALPSIAVVLDGYAALRGVAKEYQTKSLINRFKRHNDRTSAQIMAEVLQLTTESLDVGEEVIIESAITEGVRVKPGVEAGGNPTIPVGALYGKPEHCRRYGRGINKEVTMLSMGSDVIEGTTKSVKGLHSSMTAIFITESGFKRHLPDIYVERWMAGSYFPEFNPRDTSLKEEAEIIANACGVNFKEMTAFFLDRPRHHLAMDMLNSYGVATPYDKDGDLFPALVMGLPGLCFPDGRCLTSMIGEIGGSAEWAVGAIPLVWRGGQSLGMMTSQSSLTRKDLSPKELWNERFHYTENELILLQDARFEQKPYFTVNDIMENPYAGGYSAFCSISDNYYLPQLKGVSIDLENNTITTNTLVINSLGITQHWQLKFKCTHDMTDTAEKMRSPKAGLRDLSRTEIEAKIRVMADDAKMRFRLKQFFVNEYYPAIIHVTGRMVILDKNLESLIERFALSEYDRDIVRAVKETIPEWFTQA